MTYDSKINFYNIRGALTQPQQLTVGDVNDMFVPLVDGFMCTVEESEAVIDSLMEQIPTMYADTRETETVLGPVIQAGKEAFKVNKLFVYNFNASVSRIFSSRLLIVPEKSSSSITICRWRRLRASLKTGTIAKC